MKSSYTKAALTTVGAMVVARDFLLDKTGLQRRTSTSAKIGNALLFFSVGAAIGAGTALLFAPSAGPQLRTDIALKAGEWKGKLTAKKDRVVAAAQDVQSQIEHH